MQNLSKSISLLTFVLFVLCVHSTVGARNLASSVQPDSSEYRVIEFQTGDPLCVVSAEEQAQHPECIVGEVFSTDSSTQTCGKNTIIPEDKIGTCADAQAVLNAHNAARSKYGAAPLLWSRTLAQASQAVADTCVFAHSNTKYGENLASGPGLSCLEGTQLWIDEESLYPPPGGPGFSSQTGHFTQVVWKNTIQVGCGVRSCPFGNFLVCQYYPAGNVIGSFDTQVGQAGDPSPCGSSSPPPSSPPPSPPTPPTPSPPTPPMPSPPTPPPPLGPECCIFNICRPWLCPATPPTPPRAPSPSPPPPPPPPPPPAPQQCCYFGGFFCFSC